MSNSSLSAVFGTGVVLYAVLQSSLAVLFGNYGLQLVVTILICLAIAFFLFQSSYKSKVAAGQQATAVRQIVKVSVITAVVMVAGYVGMLVFFAAFMFTIFSIPASQ